VERVDLNALSDAAGVEMSKSGRSRTTCSAERTLCALAFDWSVEASESYPERLYHKTPGWVGTGARFHLRFRASPAQSPALTDSLLGPQLLAAARRYHDLEHWHCELFLLMPDHVHLMAIFPENRAMSVVVRNWKRSTSKFDGVCWQSNYFDHRLRSDRASNETWHYIRRNPVVKGLCPAEGDWPWWTAPARREDGARRP
jgi:REP element-mobilizing transposase RayT